MANKNDDGAVNLRDILKYSAEILGVPAINPVGYNMLDQAVAQDQIAQASEALQLSNTQAEAKKTYDVRALRL